MKALHMNSPKNRLRHSPEQNANMSQFDGNRVISGLTTDWGLTFQLSEKITIIKYYKHQM